MRNRVWNELQWPQTRMTQHVANQCVIGMIISHTFQHLLGGTKHLLVCPKCWDVDSELQSQSLCFSNISLRTMFHKYNVFFFFFKSWKPLKSLNTVPSSTPVYWEGEGTGHSTAWLTCLQSKMWTVTKSGMLNLFSMFLTIYMVTLGPK